jgi:phytoene desaturase
MNTSSGKTAVVIGAGVAGLASAIRLASLGFNVLILEANSFPGGKLSEIQSGKYRFDAGPSLFTMPHLVEELYWISGKKSKEFKYKKLEEICRYFYPDGTRFNAPADRDRLKETLSLHLHEDPSKIESYLNRSQFKYETIGKLFLGKCLRKISTFLNQRAFRSYLNLPKLGLFESLHSYNKSIFRNPKTIQLFDRYATYNGSDPYQTPAVMSMIPHLEMGIGAYFPENGMIQITNSLVQLAQEVGVRILLDSPADKIETKAGKASGVWSRNEFIHADLVVSAIDVSQTYTRLLNMPDLGSKYLKLPKSSSAIIWYWGISRKTEETGLHNIFFSSDYKGEFDALFKSKVMPADPTIYLNISSKERPSDAAAGGENWFVMVNAPANEGQNWASWIAATREVVLSRLSSELGFNVKDFIVEETYLDPISLESRTGAKGGALYGSNSNSPFAAFLRHANVSSTISNLFFCGGTVHPGGGIPLALQSAALAESYVRERFGL